MTATSTADRAAWSARVWRQLCRLLAHAFYRRVEIEHLERLPRSGPVLLCSNHMNAFADAILLQAALPRRLHPIARSGLFDSFLLRPLLALAGAIPIYRRSASAPDPARSSADPARPGADPARSSASPERNRNAFERCYQVLAESGAILIFPEGESHSAPQLKPLKTGAARIALGLEQSHGVFPTLVPVSLSYSRRGRFRSSVLVQIGRGIDSPCARPTVAELTPAEPETAAPEITPAETAVRALTARLSERLAEITLNVESWQDLDLLNRIDRFLAICNGIEPEERPLALRFRALRRLIDVHRQLRILMPRRIASVRRQLRAFERMNTLLGVRAHHRALTRTGRRSVLAMLATALSVLLFVVPLGLWGALNGALPYWLTRLLAPRLIQRQDQLDTTKLLCGVVLFPLFWTLQTWWVLRQAGVQIALLYVASLVVGGLAALPLLLLRKRIWLDLRTFWVLRDRRQAVRFLQDHGRALEAELEELARIAREIPPEELPLAS